MSPGSLAPPSTLKHMLLFERCILICAKNKHRVLITVSFTLPRKLKKKKKQQLSVEKLNKLHIILWNVA